MTQNFAPPNPELLRITQSSIRAWIESKDHKTQGRNSFYFDSIESTNTFLKNCIHSRSVCAAGQQTSGRGRGTNLWHSEPGQALLCSWSYKLSQFPAPVLTLRLGLALYEAVEHTLKSAQSRAKNPFQLLLKAPNDVHLELNPSPSTSNPREIYKLSGLLTETVNHTPKEVCLVVGVGLNLVAAPERTEPFPAISLNDAGIQVTPHLIQTLLTEITTGFDQLILTTHSVQKELSLEERQKLASVLALHPNHAALKAVSAAGDLLYPNRTVAWSEL